MREGIIMVEIGHGIDVYYEKDYYTLLFMDKRCEERPVGSLIFEMIRDESFYIMLTKSRNAILSFPDFNDLLTIESLNNGFRWLCELTEDEDLPVVTEIFQSSFSELIYELLDNEDQQSLDQYSIGQFLLQCYEAYKINLTAFAVYVEANSAVNSGSKDPFWNEINDEFQKSAEEYYNVYKRKCKIRRRNQKTYIEFVNIQTPLELLLLDYCRMKKNNQIIKQCVNCGRYFIPKGRNDTMFCDAPSPQDSEKTCKEIGSLEIRKKKLKNDPIAKTRHQEYSKWSMAAKRAREKGEDETYYLKKLREITNKNK